MIKSVDLVHEYTFLKSEIDSAIGTVLSSGRFLLGPELEALEKWVSEYIGVNHAIGVGSGTDALYLSMAALGIGSGDEVIVPAYTFFATAEAVSLIGGRPVFVDVDPETFCIDVVEVEKAITKKTKAVIPVHLFGQSSNLEDLKKVVDSNSLYLIEDNAQALGCEFKGKKTGSFGDLGAISFYPSKNLGTYGDGGMIVTNDADLADILRLLRNHGSNGNYQHERIGWNSRLDEIQCSILNVKSKYLDSWNLKRNEIALRYNYRLRDTPVVTPIVNENCKHVYNQYVIKAKDRDNLSKTLEQNEIETRIYYPEPVNLASPYNHDLAFSPNSSDASKQTLALPISPWMSMDQADYVCDKIIEHHNSNLQ